MFNRICIYSLIAYHTPRVAGMTVLCSDGAVSTRHIVPTSIAGTAQFDGFTRRTRQRHRLILAYRLLVGLWLYSTRVSNLQVFVRARTGVPKYTIVDANSTVEFSVTPVKWNDSI